MNPNILSLVSSAPTSLPEIQLPRSTLSGIYSLLNPQHIHRLSHSDLEKVSETLRNLYAQTNSDQLPRVMIDLLERLIPCVSISYDEMDMKCRTIRAIHNAPSQTERLLQLLPTLAANIQEHPIVQRHHLNGDEQPLKISDFLTNQQFRRTAIYNEFYNPLDVRYHLSFYVPTLADYQLAISLHLKDKDFTERDRAVLVHLAPHFTQAHRNAAVFSNAQLETNLLNRALQTTSQEMVLLTDAGRIQWLTERGEQWLRLYFNAGAAFGQILPEDLSRWIRQHRQRLAEGKMLASPFQSLQVQRGDRQLTVRLSETPEGQTSLLLTEGQSGVSPDALKKLGLSQREIEALRWVVEGKNNPEIAAIMGISPRTVEKHLQSIFSKLGVENRFAAIALVRGV